MQIAVIRFVYKWSLTCNRWSFHLLFSCFFSFLDFFFFPHYMVMQMTVRTWRSSHEEKSASLGGVVLGSFASCQRHDEPPSEAFSSVPSMSLVLTWPLPSISFIREDTVEEVDFYLSETASVGVRFHFVLSEESSWKFRLFYYPRGIGLSSSGGYFFDTPCFCSIALHVAPDTYLMSQIKSIITVSKRKQTTPVLSLMLVYSLRGDLFVSVRRAVVCEYAHHLPPDYLFPVFPICWLIGIVRAGLLSRDDFSLRLNQPSSTGCICVTWYVSVCIVLVSVSRVGFHLASFHVRCRNKK